MENKPKLEPSEVEKEKGKSKCPICKEDATLVCGGCQSVSYCSVVHQKKHWKLHQSSCVFFHIKDDPREFTGAGKYCVASRDLKPGTVILEEFPLFQMPANDLDRCITCGIELPPKIGRNASNSCPKCNWPVCGTACAEFPLHAANECQVFVASGIIYPKIIADSPLSELQLAVLPSSIRSIAFAIQNPDRWKELLEMINWEDIRSRSLHETIDNTLVLGALKIASSHFPNITPRRGDHSLMMGVLEKLTLLILTQGYKIWVKEVSAVPRTIISEVSDIRQRTGAYVYKTARHFVHSCSPNCLWTVGTFPDFKMQIRTSVAVKKGEKLTVFRFIYDEQSFTGTQNRQKLFQSFFHSPCRCNLCLDPTEFGTYQSAVVCELCKTDADASLGFLLPIDSLNIADDAPWKCNKCKKITTASKFCDKIENIFRDLKKQLTENIASEDEVRPFIEMHRNKLVHPNHWIIQFAVKFVQACQHPRIRLMNMEEVSGFEKLMYFLLDIKDKTFPGIIHERSSIVDALGKAIWRRLLTPVVTPSLQEDFYKEFLSKSSEDLLPILEEIEKCEQYQKEALLYYKHPPNIGRGQTGDHYLSVLQFEMKSLENFKTTLLSQLAQIEMERLSL